MTFITTPDDGAVWRRAGRHRTVRGRPAPAPGVVVRRHGDGVPPVIIMPLIITDYSRVGMLGLLYRGTSRIRNGTPP